VGVRLDPPRRWPNHLAANERPALLVSIHDVSPLTLAASQRAVGLMASEGVPIEALTLLVIPRHENRAPLDRDEPARNWLRQLADSGACLAMHGLTHRMEGRVCNPLRWLVSRGFARGQGEFFVSDRHDFAQRLQAARAIFRSAGLEEALPGFVPPAWLLSSAASVEVKQSGFEFHERFSGIVCRDVVRARRLIGFGSLSSIEAVATSALGRWQSLRTPEDTRLAIHPADMARPSTVRAIRAVLGNLRGRLQPLNYAMYLRGLG
jgi:predicted deacetylase